MATSVFAEAMVNSKYLTLLIPESRGFYRMTACSVFHTPNARSEKIAETAPSSKNTFRYVTTTALHSSDARLCQQVLMRAPFPSSQTDHSHTATADSLVNKNLNIHFARNRRPTAGTCPGVTLTMPCHVDRSSTATGVEM
jgi:hypothetical protein